MVTKRALKTFEYPLNYSTETMDDEKEMVRRVEKSLDSIVSKRVKDQRLRETHGQLWKETRAAVNTLKTIEIQEDKNRIIWEDSKAKIIDSMEKLTTPCPFNKQEMFGRDKEVSGIKEELLNNQRGTSIIIIRGDTGSGKTMLAQYLFEERQVSDTFHVKDWINCDDVKDKHIFEEDGRYILAHIIMISYNWSEGTRSGTSSKRCPTGLIVFDGWPSFTHEDSLSLLRTALSFIVPGKPMSLKILVTTNNLPSQHRTWRSKSHDRTTTIELLKGLEDEESRALFETLAFSSEESNHEKTRILESKLVSNILNKCGNNPCVIKTVASILSSKITVEEWTDFIEVVWPSLDSPIDTITSNLNLVSFKRLPFFMKRCLLYCSLFPKDYEFNRADLNLWLAVEFEISPETAPEFMLIGDEYLRELHNMGYFIEYGKINADDDDTLSYKMPIFSYEFVKNMAKEYKEYQSFGTGDNEHVEPRTIQHVSFVVDGISWHVPSWLGEAKNLRSLVFLGKSCENVTGIDNIVKTSPRLLQILNITMVNCEKLACYFENLEMVRSLTLGKTCPDFFTKFVTRMPNLRVLDLQHSNPHIILSQGFQKLASLRHLYVGGKINNDETTASRGELVPMPKSTVLMMSENNALHTLADYNYIIENQKEDHSRSDKISNDIHKYCDKSLIWESITSADDDDDIVLKALQAPLKSLTIRCWKGLTLPRFLDLASIQIMDCHKCEYCDKCESLPLLGTLLKLKSLTLSNLTTLKYIESNIGYPENKPYFPSLESLTLANLPKLEAWKDYQRTRSSSSEVKLIPKVIKLQISSTKIDYLPIMGNLVSLEVNDISVKLLEDLISSSPSSSTSSVLTSKSSIETLKTLTINKVRGLDSLLSIKLPLLESLIIRHCHELPTLVVESPYLKSCEFHECYKLQKIWMVCEDDIAQLTKLEIECCPKLDLHTMIPWKSLANLSDLKLMNLSKLESLPDEISCLAKLKTLAICWVYDLKTLPEWIGNLRHLDRLVVRNCPSLTDIPDSLGELLNNNSGNFRVEFICCQALKRLHRSFLRNHLSQIVIKECPKLKTSMLKQDDGSI